MYKTAHVKSQISQTNRNLQEFCGKTHNWELRQRGRQQELSLSQRSLSLGSLKQKEGIPENGSTEIKARQAQWDMMCYAQRVERLGWVESECRKVVNREWTGGGPSINHLLVNPKWPVGWYPSHLHSGSNAQRFCGTNKLESYHVVIHSSFIHSPILTEDPLNSRFFVWNKWIP